MVNRHTIIGIMLILVLLPVLVKQVITNGQRVMAYTDEEIAEAWVLAAEDEWSHMVDSVDDADIISRYFRCIGWQWHLNQHTEGGDYDEFVRQRLRGAGLDWCGVFIAAMGMRIGNFLEPDRCVDVRIHPDLAYHILPSTYRLQPHSEFWEKVSVPPFQIVPLADIRRGDIITLQTRTTGSKEYGDHIAIVQDVDHENSTVRTIEGNAGGYSVKNHWHRGVVQRDRRWSMIRRVYRPTVLQIQNDQ